MLYKELNISAASKQLFITQQGLSRQIKAIEKELDVMLFRRMKSGVVPTEVCHNLIPHLQSLYTHYTQTLATLDTYKQRQKNHLSIAFAYGISNGASTDFIFDYAHSNTDITLEIQEWSKQVCINKLQNNEIDIAFLVNPFPENLFYSFKVAEGYMYAAIHKDHPLLLEAEPIDFSRLDGEAIITGSKENALRAIFDYFCTLIDIKPNIIVSSSYSLNFVNAMLENVGIATVTPAMAAKITNPNIHVKRLLTPEPGYLYCCISPAAQNNKEVLSFIQYIKDYFALRPIFKI